MVQTCGISEKFKIVRLSPTNAVENFDCGDRDLNDYITNRASLFDQYMLAVSYTCIDSGTKQILAYFSLANDKIATIWAFPTHAWGGLSRVKPRYTSLNGTATSIPNAESISFGNNL